MREKNHDVRIGWAQADITPDRPVLLAGQFHARVSEGIRDRVTATALAIESPGRTGTAGQVVMVSCDVASVADELRDGVRARIRAEVSDLDPMSVFLGATHTHTAPDDRVVPYGVDADYRQRVKAAPNGTAGADKFGMWPDVGLDAMPPADYLNFAVGRIAAAVRQAWETRGEAAIAYGLGHAVIGRNRRLTFQGGTSQMYGNPRVPAFRHVEGYEDHTLQAMMTYDRNRTLTGIVVNVPCPSQVSENDYLISADYWHETREELRKRFGKDLFVLAQCAPAGDQSPHVLIGKRAEERMWRLQGLDLAENAPRREIARKIADAIGDILPCAEQELDGQPRFEHTVEVLNLPRRKISEKDVEEALAEALPFQEKYHVLLAELEADPSIRRKPRWYTEITRTYRLMERGARVRERFDLQQRQPEMPTEVHAVRLGEIAFATNPFELYLDYAVRIRELSQAVQTFLIQKAGCNGTYLPSERSVSHKGYGSVPASTDIGPEGGDKLVEWTVETLNRLWS